MKTSKTLVGVFALFIAANCGGEVADNTSKTLENTTQEIAQGQGKGQDKKLTRDEAEKKMRGQGLKIAKPRKATPAEVRRMMGRRGLIPDAGVLSPADLQEKLKAAAARIIAAEDDQDLLEAFNAYMHIVHGITSQEERRMAIKMLGKAQRDRAKAKKTDKK